LRPAAASGKVLAAMARTLALAAALLVTAAGAAPAQAKVCAKTAKLVSGTVVIPGYDEPQPPTPENPMPSPYPTRNPAKDRTVTHLRRGEPYLVPRGKRAVLVMQGVRYRLGPDSEFLLACFGRSRAQGGIHPRVSLASGSAEVTAKAGKPGAVSTGMGMVDPFADGAARFRVRITGDEERPTVTMKRTRGPAKLNVTPYAGPRAGTCRQVVSARFVATQDGARVYYDGVRVRR
jgi:hypothetical protein